MLHSHWSRKLSGFNGQRVLSFESRRAKEIAQLIRNYGGVPIVAPSMRAMQTPNDSESAAIKDILNNEFAVIIFMTGVGARALVQGADGICPRNELLDRLRRTAIVVRGPKPAAVMRELGLSVTISVPEPNTWREIVTALDENADKVPLKGTRVAIQEHGEPSEELYTALRQRGAAVTAIRVYRWELPEDTGPLKAAIREVARNAVDVVMFTSSVQFVHALQVAQELNLREQFMAGLEHAKVASIGPVCSQTLQENGIRIDIQPSHPKMGFLVKEAAERAAR
jgi:uroporphyrinogen-III synthase